MINFTKTAVAITAPLILSACVTLPSFYDDNESRISVDVRLAVEQLDCTEPTAPQVKRIKDAVDWFVLYNDSKGSSDIVALTRPMQETADSFYTRSLSGATEGYCNIKKKVLQQQSKTIASTVMGRY